MYGQFKKCSDIKSNDKKNENYKKILLKKYFEDVHENRSPDGWTSETPVVEDMQQVAWMDWHGPGVKFITKEKNGL